MSRPASARRASGQDAPLINLLPVHLVRSPPNTPEYRVERNLWRFLDGYNRAINIALSDTFENATERMVRRLNDDLANQFENSLSTRMEELAKDNTKQVVEMIHENKEAVQKSQEAAEKSWQEQKEFMKQEQREFKNVVETLNKSWHSYNDNFMREQKQELRQLLETSLKNSQDSMRNQWQTDTREFLKLHQSEFREMVQNREDVLFKRLEGQVRLLTQEVSELEDKLKTEGKKERKQTLQEIENCVMQALDDGARRGHKSIEMEMEKMSKQVSDQLAKMVGEMKSLNSSDSAITGLKGRLSNAVLDAESIMKTLSNSLDSKTRDLSDFSKTANRTMQTMEKCEDNLDRMSNITQKFEKMMSESQGKVQDVNNEHDRLKNQVQEVLREFKSEAWHAQIQKKTEEEQEKMSQKMQHHMDRWLSETNQHLSSLKSNNMEIGKVLTSIDQTNQESKRLFDTARGHGTEILKKLETCDDTLKKLPGAMKGIENDVQTVKEDINQARDRVVKYDQDLGSNIKDLEKLLKERIEKTAEQLDTKYNQASKTLMDGATSLPELKLSVEKLRRWNFGGLSVIGTLSLIMVFVLLIDTRLVGN